MTQHEKRKAVGIPTWINRIAQVVVGTAAVVTYLGASAVTWPSAPLGATTSATPMTMLVMGRDHKLFYEAYNDASDVDGDGTLDVRFKPTINYYGLFDANLCYNYASNLYSPGSTSDNLGRCKGNARWSGRWLNYMTTTRIDALRKVLYGGQRETDTTSQTVLRRAYIPQDAHSWGKEYFNEATDGYRISDYTPLGQPTTNTRHFFGSLTDTAGINCATLSNCSNRPPLLRVRTSVGDNKRIWEWASKERPVLAGTLITGDFPSGTGSVENYSVRVEVCTASFNAGCKQYPNKQYKPVGLLHDYGENESMYFGLLTGSYDTNMSGGRLRKVVSSFATEVNSTTGQFNATAPIVNSINSLRIRDFNNGNTSNEYRNGFNSATRSMNEGEFADWGNPIGEMLYEATRYFAGRSAATSAFSSSTTRDAEVGLASASWDDPYSTTSAARASACARASFLTISDINPSYDSDQLPGAYSGFGTFTGDLTGLNVETIGTTITGLESNITGLRFIGQSDAVIDTAPTAKQVNSLGRIRGLAPEEPTKQGSYYSASVSKYAKETDLRSDFTGKQSVDNYVVALSSPLPKIEVKTRNNRLVTVIPFAKSVSGAGISNNKGSFQPTNQIVDFYVEQIANSGAKDADTSVNGGRYYAEFRISFEDVEQGADHDMDAIARYVVLENALGQVEITVTPTYEAGGIGHAIGYIVSGTSNDGIYLVAKDRSDTPAYFLNVRPGQTAGNCDVSPVPAACGSLLPYAEPRTGSPTPTAYVFTPSTSPAATLLKDPLWYAAKYGGYVDSNGSGTLDQTAEWDKDGDGVPDTYFFVQNPLGLRDSLKKSFENIILRAGSGGNVVANSTNLSTETFVFQGVFNSEKWSGDVIAYQVLPDTTVNGTFVPGGVNQVPAWKASEKIPLPANRKIYFGSINNSGSLTGKVFNWNQLSGAEEVLLGNWDVLNYLRGDRSKEKSVGGSGSFRTRNAATVLGDISHSSPFFLRDTNTVFIGANDGMLHAFNSLTGVEQFAYIPSAVFGRLKNLTRTEFDQSHEYFVDGDIAVSSASQTNGKNYLVGTLGRGGKGLFGLDVSSPNTFGTSNVLWEYFNASDVDLGFMLGRPIITRLQNGTPAIIVGNGYNSADQRAVLYVFNLMTGALIRKIDTGVAGDNGLATPGLILDSAGKVTAAYAGDLMGNVWKFDLSSSIPASWSVATGGAPLFTATSSSGGRQPITAPISLTMKTLPELNSAADPHVGDWFVHFGTGSDFQISDPGNKSAQSWYGLIDTGTSITRSLLLQTPGFDQTGTVAGKPVRTLKIIQPEAMKLQKGWVIDLPESGERMVTASKYFKLANPTLVASSVIPIEDVCKPGGRGYLNAVNPFTGGRLLDALFDVNNNSGFTDDVLNGVYLSSVDIGIGKPGEPVLIGNQMTLGGSDGKVGSIRINRGGTASNLRGRISWREIIR
jgi:type IV pilus assembly protein PilY1